MCRRVPVAVTAAPVSWPPRRPSLRAMYANVPGLKVIERPTRRMMQRLVEGRHPRQHSVLFMESERMYGDKGEIPNQASTCCRRSGRRQARRRGRHPRELWQNSGAGCCLKWSCIDAEVIDLHYWSHKKRGCLIRSVKKTNRLVVIDKKLAHRGQHQRGGLPRAEGCLRLLGRTCYSREPGRSPALHTKLIGALRYLAWNVWSRR